METVQTAGARGQRWLDIIDAHPRAKLAFDRVEAVTRGRIPDRVPFCDYFWPAFAKRYRRERNLAPEVTLAEHFDFDYQDTMAPLHGPWPGRAGVVNRDADGYVVKRNEFGLLTRELDGPMSMPQHLGSLVEEKKDLDRIPFEDPADPRRWEQVKARLPDVCTRFAPIFKLGGPFSRAWQMRGLSRFLMDVAEDEPFVMELVTRLTDHMIAVGMAMIDALDLPATHWHIADDFAAVKGPLISPASYERVIYPNLKRMVDALHSRGYTVSFESEGRTAPMLSLLDAAGVDGLAHLEPRAGMLAGDIRERYGDRFFIMGNVCNTQVLPSNDRAQVEAEVRRVLQAGQDGRLMHLSAHSIAPDVTSDTYDYFWNLMNELGRYRCWGNGVRERRH